THARPQFSFNVTFPSLPAARGGWSRLNQATLYWNPMLVQRVILLPPDAGEDWDGGRAQAACGQALRPHPDPPPSQGEGNLWPISGGRIKVKGHDRGVRAMTQRERVGVERKTLCPPPPQAAS